ncbi:MAG: hypothetical protein SGBAC_004239 [Bacillariaceae sp.]
MPKDALNKEGIRAMGLILGVSLLVVVANQLFLQPVNCREGYLSEVSYAKNNSLPISDSSMETPISSQPKIPHRFVFNAARDFWNGNVEDLANENHRSIYRLLRRAVVMFQKVWRENGYTNISMADAMSVKWNETLDDDTEVVFLTDKECETVIKSIEPRMVDPFRKEGSGRFKSDICRIYSLYDGGGYYLDTDLLVHEAPFFLPHVSFASIIEPDFQDKFHNAFIAVAPKHPIIAEAINVMTEHYVTKKGNVTGVTMGYITNKNMGTWTLREAHKRIMQRLPNMANEMVLLQELNLDNYPTWFPEVPRPKKGNNRLRYAGVNLASHKLHFWSKGYRNYGLKMMYGIGDPPDFKFVPFEERNSTAE